MLPADTVDAILRAAVIPLKASAVRRVHRTTDGRHVVKVYFPRTLADRIRWRAWHSPARTEARTLVQLAACGLPVPRPVAWRRSAAADVLILEHEESLGNLHDLAESGQLDVATRQHLATAIAQALARMHAAGVWHRDCHAGNVLVAPDRRAILLLDFHRARSWTGAVPENRAFADLVGFGHFFLTRSSLRERVRFVRAYFAPRALSPVARKRATRTLSARLVASWRALLRRKARRCTSVGREFARARCRGLRGFAAAGDESARLIAFLAQLPRSPFDVDGDVLLATSRARVVRVTIADRSDVVKIFRDHGMVAMLKRLARGSRARRAWLNQHRFALRGLRTARGLLVLDGALWHGRSMMVMEHVVGESLREFVARTRPRDPTRRQLWRELARQLRWMHDSLLRNRDLKAENVLVAHGEPVFLDLDGVRPVRGPSAGVIARDLMRLNASFPAVPGPAPAASQVSLAERLRFLRWYCRCGLRRLPHRALRDAIRTLTLHKWSRPSRRAR
ncbi:MAG: lipopolysaccharide kinase InaA family protein [Planctomycetota bacterium]